MLRRSRWVSRHVSRASLPKRESLVTTCKMMSVTMLSACLGVQTANLTLGIVRQALQPMAGNVRLYNAASLSLTGFHVSPQ